jgi:hypothetical protein
MLAGELLAGVTEQSESLREMVAQQRIAKQKGFPRNYVP